MSLSAPKKRLHHLGEERAQTPISKRYSVVVRMLRLMLPLIAVGIIGLVMAWPQVEEAVVPIEEQASIPQSVGKNELVNPRFESRDEKDQPYTITAERAIQSARDPSVILLEKPMADITMNDGTWMAGEAEQGAYRQDTEKLLLKGKVKLFHDNGYELKTEKLQVDMQARTAWSDQPVHAQGPAGTLDATGMQADSANNRLIFTGPLKLVLNRSVEGIP